MESAAIECAGSEPACEGSPCTSMGAGKPSQQIAIENGRSPAGMKPNGMSARKANETSMKLARGVRLLRVWGRKPISRRAIL